MKQHIRITRKVSAFIVWLVLTTMLMFSCGGGGDTSNSGSIPAVTTVAASSMTPTDAILNGTVIPNGLQTQAWFEYGTDNAFATFASSPKQDAGDGLTSQTANVTWSGLEAGTTYFFRFCAENSSGSSKGQIVSFTTSSPGGPPTVTTLSVTSVGATVATLNGSVSPNGLETIAWFEYGGDPSFKFNGIYPGFFFTPSQSVGSGTSSQLVAADITGIAIGVTYYYRIVASNAKGYTRGSVLSFGPFGAPFVTTLAATSVGATSAELNGIVTPNSMGTTIWFEYGMDSTLDSSASTSPQAVGSGTTRLPVKAVLSGLATGTTYYYRIASSNSSGAAKGNIASVTIGTAPGPGEWTATGPMVVPRSGHTATLLPNGKALVVGGVTFSPSFAYLSSAELYDPATGTWVSTGSMGTARVGHTATLLPNGKVLVAGGEQFMIGIFSSAELYDPATGTWVNTGSMGTARSAHTATLLQNGKVLVAGGTDYLICSYGGCDHHSSSSAELYDPSTGTWVNTGSMAIARGYHKAILLQNGKVLVLGRETELFAPATGTWDNTGSHTLEGGAFSATLLSSGEVLVAGGGYDTSASKLSSAELYDAVTTTWVNTGLMVAPRSGHTATLLLSDKVLVTGGGGTGDLATAELYVPATGTWANTGLMMAPRSGHTATLLPSGKVLVAGGNGTDYLSAELYNP